METPLFDHLNKTDYENVYEPAEDTFLLLDAIESDLTYIKQELKPLICLEIGSGSGVVITAIAKQLKSNTFCLASDINKFACDVSKRTANRNQTTIDSVNMNLAQCFCNHLFDLVVFNPPYVVTTDEECVNEKKNLLTYTWAGGSNGRLVIDKFLENLDQLLSNKGTAYLLLLKENKPHDIVKNLIEKNFIACVLIDRKIIGEHLFVVKIIKTKN